MTGKWATKLEAAGAHMHCTCPTMFDLVGHHLEGERDDHPEFDEPTGLIAADCPLHGRNAEPAPF